MIVNDLGINDAAFREFLEFLYYFRDRVIAEALSPAAPEGHVVCVDQGVVPVPFEFCYILARLFQTI
jgi:hypothetical protein